VLDPLILIIDALAVFRLTRLIVADGIFDRPRNWILTRFPGAETEFYADAVERVPRRLVPVSGSSPRVWVAVEPSWLGRLLECCWCVSVWTAAGVVVARQMWGWWEWPALVLAYAAVAGMLHRHNS